MDFKVLSNYKAPRIIPVKVNADGTLANPMPHITSAKTATGEYTLTVKPAFQVSPFAFGTAIKDGVTRKYLNLDKATLANTTVKFKTFTVGDVAADSAFMALIFGSDGGSLHSGNMTQPVKIPMYNNRLLLFSYDGASAVQQAGLNPYEGTIVKTGTGLYTLTLRQPFSKDVFVGVQCSSLTRTAEIVSANNKTISIEVVNSTSSVAADGEILIWVIGQRGNVVGQRMLYPLMCPHAFTYLNPFEYIGSGSPGMVRGAAVFAPTKVSTAYTFTNNKRAQRSSYGLACADGSIITGVNTRTDAGFNIDVETDGRVYGLEIAMRRGRYWG